MQCCCIMATDYRRPEALNVCLAESKQMGCSVCFCSSDTNHQSNFWFVCELYTQREIVKSSNSIVVLFILSLDFCLRVRA